MSAAKARGGFTLIEMLVATLLLGMLVTALTMLFNSSSIAWRTGMATVSVLDDARSELGNIHDVRDEVLPGLGEGTKAVDSRKLQYRTVSLWDESGANKLRTDRAYDTVDTLGPLSETTAAKGEQVTVSGGDLIGGSLFTVGVRSAGPNREYGDEDDVTTWPDGVF